MKRKCRISAQLSAYVGDRRVLATTHVQFVFHDDGTPSDHGICVEHMGLEWSWPVMACLMVGEHEDCVFTLRLEGTVHLFQLHLPIEQHIVSAGLLIFDCPTLADWFGHHYLEESAA